MFCVIGSSIQKFTITTVIKTNITNNHCTALNSDVHWLLAALTCTPVSSSADAILPDQKRCAHMATPLHWSGFFSKWEHAIAELVFSVSWFSSPRQVNCSITATISAMAACWALLSEMSPSQRANAYKNLTKKNFLVQNFVLRCETPNWL